MSKNKIILFAIALVMMGAQTAMAKTINITVNGMVCAFCAQGITKKFKSESAIQDVKVDLDKKNVKLETKDGQDITDDVITKNIAESGFNIVSIKRE